jgi:hypothetical protein
MPHKVLLGTVLFFLLSSTLCAQPVAGDSLVPPGSSHQTAALIVSDVSVAISIASDAWVSWKSPDRKRAFIMQGFREGTVLMSSEIIKRLVHRNRPDLSDTKSFWSEHTAFSASALRGPRLAFVVPLVIGTGDARVLARKHYLSDVVVGGLVGFGASFIR